MTLNRVLYVTVTMTLFIGAMLLFGHFVVHPLQDWAEPFIAKVPPEITLGVAFIGIPVAWFAFYKIGKRKGWV